MVQKHVNAHVHICQFVFLYALCTTLCQHPHPWRHYSRYVRLNPGKGAHNVCKACAGTGGAQGLAQDARKERTRSRKVKSAQGMRHKAPGTKTHKVRTRSQGIWIGNNEICKLPHVFKQITLSSSLGIAKPIEIYKKNTFLK